jgi:TolB-like protein
MAADIVGFSRLMESDENAALAQVKRLRQDNVEPVLKTFGGRIFKWMGDGFLAEFQSPVMAVEAALAIQASLVRTGSALKLRIGINLGDVIAESDGDLYGDGVNIAARLEQICEPGAVFLSGNVYDEVRNRLKLKAADLGTRSLKNIQRPVRVFSVAGISPEDVRSGLGLVARRRPRVIASAVAFLVVLAAASVILFGGLLLRRAQPVDAGAPSLAVFPVVAASEDLKHLAEEFTDQLSDKLGRDRALKVIALPELADSSRSAVELGRSAGATYVLTGALRGEGPRLSLRLAETLAGGQVWADSYVARSSRESPEEAAKWAASAITGWTGAIALSEFQRSQDVAPEDLHSYQCTVQAYQSTINQTSDAFAKRSRICLESLLARNPNQAELWAMLSQVLALQRWWGTGLDGAGKTTVWERASLVPKAMLAANRAVELSPDDPVGHFALTRAYNLACLADQVRVEALRTVALNGNDPTIRGAMGNALAYTGSWDIGIPMIEDASRVLGPKTPKWWWWAVAKDHWRKGEYDRAVNAFLQAYNEQNWISHLQMAYALVPAGRLDEAKAHVLKLIALYPTMTIKVADAYYEMFCLDETFRRKMAAQLKLAGLPEE